MDSKGQSLSLNVIIIAILALVVLVVIGAIFLGRITIFQAGVSKEGQAELIKMKIFYGACRPASTDENTFVRELTNAKEDLAAQDSARASFEQKISACKGFTDQPTCSNNGCLWS